MYSLSPIQLCPCIFTSRERMTTEDFVCFFIFAWILEAYPKYVLWGLWLGVDHTDMMRTLLTESVPHVQGTDRWRKDCSAV